MYLGLWTEIRPTDDLIRLTDRVAAMGFTALHAHFPQGCVEGLARALMRACSGSGLTVAAISGYANPLRPSESPMGSTLAQLGDLAAIMPWLDTRRLVSWSGTYGAKLLDDHADNHGPAALDALRRSVDALLPQLDASEAQLLIEPFFTHVLNTPAAAARFCAELGGSAIGLVLDPPNMLPPRSWEQQAELIAAGTQTIAPYVGLVHMKDMRMRDGQLDLPGPGKGVLDYPAFLRALADNAIAAPLIVKHVALTDAAEARRFVLGQAKG